MHGGRKTVANRSPSRPFRLLPGQGSTSASRSRSEIGPIFVHGAVDAFVRIYRDLGVDLPVVEKADQT